MAASFCGQPTRGLPDNPARLVCRHPLRCDEIRLLAPATVEMMRAALSQRDGTVISVLAYAGPRNPKGPRWGFGMAVEAAGITDARAPERRRGMPPSVAEAPH